MRNGSALAAALLLAGCSGEAPRGTEQTAESAQAPTPAPEARDRAAGEPDRAALPQIAYAYTHRYRLPGEAIARVQARHLAMCDALGGARCRLVALERVRGGGDYAQGSLTMMVDARIARRFGDRLDAAVSNGGGESAGRGVTAEDLSKAIVDTEARIRAKQALADRLLALIRGRAARVGELVEAERAFATAQEELEAARAWLTQMRARIAMSRVEVRYEAFGPDAGGAWQPVRRAFAEAGRTFGSSVGALVAFVVLALPWIAIMLLVGWFARRRGWRLRRHRGGTAPGDATLS